MKKAPSERNAQLWKSTANKCRAEATLFSSQTTTVSWLCHTLPHNQLLIHSLVRPLLPTQSQGEAKLCPARWTRLTWGLLEKWGKYILPSICTEAQWFCTHMLKHLVNGSIMPLPDGHYICAFCKCLHNDLHMSVCHPAGLQDAIHPSLGHQSQTPAPSSLAHTHVSTSKCKHC